MLAAVLTDRGRALVDRAAGPRFAEAEEAVSGLTTAERMVLSKLLKSFGNTLSSSAHNARRREDLACTGG
ncbi:hypothetical protein [Sphingomonas sp. dw_22]|uniref:hypothetical protein n=1 Tax=Sphingomonas sp. dw_22 TaxID=2721175 RepID=UPI001BD48C48|nr:hypothetical protein [Sphingomonas sp. dw_22]